MTSWLPTLATDRPRYVAIADAIAADLAAGRLKSGERLPPQRDLAWKLGVTLGTVTRAYQEAEKRGLLTGEVGRGSFLRGPGATATASRLAASAEPGVVDMQMASPPRVHAPAEFKAALAQIGADQGFEGLLDYPPPGGFPQHRMMGSRWLAHAGLEIPPERVVISAGAQACLVACFSTLARTGDRMLIEPLTYPTMGPITRQFGISLCPLATDEEGIIPDSVEECAKDGQGRFLYLVPTLHNPTTVTMSLERRQAIAAIARRRGLTIIEDDVFRYLADDPPPTLYSLVPERTYYIQSVSKTMAPGLRIGFMALPTDGRADIVRQQMIIGGRPVSLALEVARRWIDTGTDRRILKRIGEELNARRSIALEVLSGQSLQCEPGAMYGWLGLPPHWQAAEFAAAAQAHGVKLTPGSAFAMDRRAPNRVRVCLGPAPSREALKGGLERLRRLLNRSPAEEFQTMA